MLGICKLYVGYMLAIARLGDGEVEKNVENSERTSQTVKLVIYFFEFFYGYCLTSPTMNH